MSDCLFCRIIDREIPSKIAYEDDKVLVFHDIEPVAPIHLLAIPKKHIVNLNNSSAEDVNVLGHLQQIIGQIANDMGFADQGYRVVSNCGSGAGQVVMHLHYHIISGRPLSWPPG